MAEEKSIEPLPFFQPRAECDNLQVAYLLWKIAGQVVVTDSGCWEWLAATKTAKGYGKIGHSNKDWLVHRLVYNLCVGHVPPTLLICHRCDNPPCCNPAHLYAGSTSDNQRDAVERGNHYLPCPKGGKKARKLTDAAVRDIRSVASRGVGGGVVRRLAEKYNVSVVLISNVIHRHRYAGVPDTEAQDDRTRMGNVE